MAGREPGNLFFTARVGEVDPTLFESVQDRTDEMGPAERRRQVGVDFLAHLAEVVQVLAGKIDRLELAVGSRSSFQSRWHEVHSDSSELGVTGEAVSLPRTLNFFRARERRAADEAARIAHLVKPPRFPGFASSP